MKPNLRQDKILNGFVGLPDILLPAGRVSMKKTLISG